MYTFFWQTLYISHTYTEILYYLTTTTHITCHRLTSLINLSPTSRLLHLTCPSSTSSCSSNEHVSDYKRTRTFLARPYNSPQSPALYTDCLCWHNNKQWLWSTGSTNVNLCNFCLCDLLKIKRCDKYDIENYLTKLSVYCPQYRQQNSDAHLLRWRASDSRGPAFSEP